MTKFLEDEKNKAILLNKMILKYGAPKTDTGAGPKTTRKDALTRKITPVNPRLNSKTE